MSLAQKVSTPRGRFITVEGVDGAGKSSHLDAIVAWVQSQGFTCLLTREPGGTALGDQLRALLLHQAMSPVTELLTVFAARAEHVSALIEPALSRGDWVVCDRFTDSTRAYQGGGRGLDLALIEQLATLTHAQCQPDLTLVFDLDPTTASTRIQGRGAADRFEQESLAFSAAVRQQYLSIVANEPARCSLIDAAQPLESVRQQVLATLRDKLGQMSNWSAHR